MAGKGMYGMKTPLNAVGELPSDIQKIYAKKGIDAFGVTLQMDKYAETIEIPSGMYGQMGERDETSHEMVADGDVRGIRMTGKDDLARYLQYGDAGLMGESAKVDNTGLSAFDPYHLAATYSGTFSKSFDTNPSAGGKPLITRDWSKYEIPINDPLINDPYSRTLNDHLPDYEVEGFIKRFGDLNTIDNWVKLMLPTAKNLKRIQDQSITAAVMMDQFYRQQLLTSASQVDPVDVDVTSATGWDAFVEAIDNVVEQLSFFGAKPPLKMQTGSNIVESKSLEERFRILFPEKLARFVKKIPGFILVKDYGSKPSDPNEFGSIDNVAFVKMSSISANVSNGNDPYGNTLLFDSFGAGMRFDRYNFLVLSGESYGMLKMRGTENFKTHVVSGDSETPGNPLALRGSYGWTAFGGFIMMRSTHVWNIPVNFTYHTA